MKRVLVVDDSATVRQQVGLALSQAGFDVAEIIERDPSLSTVICDVNMPTMNGIEMLKKVKANGQHANLPIVMLTTEGSPKLVEQAKASGAKGWIVKPFKPELLVAAVKKLSGC
jgi:two-component system chemotaxis response regulator CheY